MKKTQDGPNKNPDKIHILVDKNNPKFKSGRIVVFTPEMDSPPEKTPLNVI